MYLSTSFLENLSFVYDTSDYAPVTINNLDA